MKLRKTLSLVLSVMMLLSMLTATGITLANAADATVTAINDLATYETKGIYGDANILKNATITVNATGKKSTALLVDDIATNLNEAYGSGTKCWDPCPGDAYEYVTFTLDKEYLIESLFLAGSGVSAYGANGFSVYAGKAYGDLTDADQPIYTQTANVYMGIRVDLSEAVRTNILTFKIGTKTNAGNNQVWISELAAAGTEVVPPYTVSNITDGVNEDKIIAPADNIFVNATPTLSVDGAVNAVQYDGKLCGVSDDWGWADAKGMTVASGNYATKLYFTWDLGADYEVDSFLLAGSGVANSKYGANNLTIYVGDKTGAEIKADPTVATPVYTCADLILYGRRIELNEVAVGRYVVFEMVGFNPGTGTTNAGRVWLSELAATGEKVPEPYTVTAINDLATYEEKGIYGDANILKRATMSPNHAVFTDDIVSGVSKPYADDTSMAVAMGGSANGTVKVTFTLPATYDVTGIFLAGAGTGAYGTEGFTVYDAAGNAVYTHATNVTYGLRVDFAEPVVTTKLVFEMVLKNNANNWQTWMSEFAAAGTTDEPVKPPKTEKYNIVTIGDSITHGTYFDYNAAGTGYDTKHLGDKTYPNQLEALLDASSDTIDYVVKNHGVSGTTVVSGNLVGDSRSSWYDARWSAASADVAAADAVSIMLGTNDCTLWDARSALFKQEYKKLVAAIREINPDVTIYMMTSPAAYVSTHYDILAEEIVPMQLELAAELNLKVVDVYNATRDLMRDGNASGEKGQAALFSDGEVIYVRIHPDAEGAACIADALFDAITAPTAHVSVLKYSATADTDGDLTDGKNGTDGIAPDANRVTPLANNLLVAEGVTYSGYNLEGGKNYLTDGILRYVNKASGTNHNASCDEIIVDFGTPTAITQFLLGGTQVGGTAAATFLYPGADIYVTDDLDNLGDAVWSIDNAAADASVTGRLITLPEAVTGRYMVLKVDMKTTSGTTNAWLSEIAAVGYRPEIATALGGQVRQDDNALRFGFDLTANGVAYADADPVANNNYTRDITNATIVVGGKAYTLVDFGAIVSVNANSAMTLEAAEADVTGATKSVVANNLYEVNGSTITYTAVVTNIPEEHYGTAVYARSYFTYSDGANEYTVYGDIINRSVNGCAVDAIG